MSTPLAYNWAAMQTSPAQVLVRWGEIQLGSGTVPPWVNWMGTPQGGKFWASAFMHKHVNAERALERMRRQAERDTQADYAMRYEIHRIAPSPDHIIKVAEMLEGLQMAQPYGGIYWHATPQGAEFWRDYFAQAPSTRDKEIFRGLIRAAKRAKRLRRLDD